MRERKIETMLVKQVKAAGGMALKLISPGMAGVPDRIVLLPGGRILFVELKAPGEKPRPLQRKPLLVFYTFKHDAQRIAKHLTAAGYPVSVLKGDQDIQRWNRGEIPVLLVHPASAEHGLNLQAGGHTVVWFGLPWSLELYEQGNGRIHRQGQEKPVVVYHLASIGTIDEVVMVALEGKASRQAALLAAVKAKFTQSSKTA